MSEFIPYAELSPDQRVYVDSTSIWDRRYAVDNGWGLDDLVHDMDPFVRSVVAEQGYGLEKLASDKDPLVRRAVAEQGYGLEKLINDEDLFARIIVAEQGYGLEKLINDKHYMVRQAVAEQGYGLDKLAEDSFTGVRWWVDGYLKENNLTLEEWIAQNPDKCALPENQITSEKTSLSDRIADASAKADTLNVEHTSPDHEINRGDAR